MSSLEIQRHYFELVATWLDRRGGSDSQRDVVARWDEVLTIAEDDPRRLDGIVDWATKLALLERYRERDGLDWDHPRLALVDLQFHDLRPERGILARLDAAGRIRRLVSSEDIESARRQPPTQTRAWFRGRMLQRFRSSVVAVGWDAMIIDAGRRSFVRVPMADPRRGSRAHVEELFATATSVDDLLTKLAA